MTLNLTKEQQLIIIGLVVSIIIGSGVAVYRRYFPANGPVTPIEVSQNHQVLGPVVQIGGAVRNEGVYRLKAGDRLLDALALAGGALPQADLPALNLSEQLKDGVKVVVPLKRVSEYQEIGGKGDPGIRRSENAERVVNLNTADEKALDSLAGVGPATAKAIINLRTRLGRFSDPKQLLQIPRFGKGKFEKVKGKIII